MPSARFRPARASALFALMLACCMVLPMAFTTQNAQAEDWTQVNSPGFGTSNNLYVSSMVTNGPYLFAGTTNPVSGAQVWRYDGASWVRIGRNGLGNPNNTDITSLCVYQGYIYAGTYNSNNGCEVRRFDGGTTWAQVNTDGFGDANNYGATSMLSYFEPLSNTLIVGTNNGITGSEVWTTLAQPPGGAPYTDWTQYNANGFNTDNQNSDTSALYMFNGKMYAGVTNSFSGCSVWQWGGGTTWTLESAGGFGDPSLPEQVTDLVSLGTSLYASTTSPFNSRPCQVWRTSATGPAPFLWTKVASNGFGDPNNIGAQAMVVDYGYLYVGTLNRNSGAEVWRTAELGDPPFNDWAQVNRNGFGDGGNAAVWSMVTFGTFLMAGTEYPDGCGVYKGYRGAGPTWYLAEGSTAWGFSTYISLENPNGLPVNCDFTYMPSDGPVVPFSINMPANSRATVNPWDTLGQRDFSTMVHCRENLPIAVDRTMMWTGAGAPTPEAHSSVGVTFPDRVWYLPEGSSNWGFETWLLIQNPNGANAHCAVTYMIEGEGPRTFNKTVPANARGSFNMADDIGAKDASIKVVSDLSVIPERAMYRNNRREGHDSIGTIAPAPDYYLAEGTTAWGFTTYILIQNPNPQPTDVFLTYMTPGGPQGQPVIHMNANSRKTIRVNDVLPNTDFSTEVEAHLPIIAERAMYWNNGTGEACHDSIGLSSPHKTFYLPDGEVAGNVETWTLVQNPNSSAVSVFIQYFTPGGGGPVVTDTIPANSRKTYSMADSLPDDTRAAIFVHCTSAGKKIMVERAMYWNNRGAGTDTIGGSSD